jgi:hypothetical protein
MLLDDLPVGELRELDYGKPILSERAATPPK